MDAKKEILRHHKIKLFSIMTLLVATLGIWGWFTLRATPVAKIPTSISNDLLFTPYVPHKLPAGYALVTSTFIQKEGALFFAAYNKKGDRITFSEQTAPKNFDANGFYETNIKNPARLRNTTFATIFGDKNGQAGSIVGITTSDNTWVIASSDEALSRADAIELSKGLVKQD